MVRRGERRARGRGLIGPPGRVEERVPVDYGAACRAPPPTRRRTTPPPGTGTRRSSPGLRAGDEEAFATLVSRYHASLKRIARMYVSTDAVAEDLVQETWLAVIDGIHRFEHRSSFRTWLFHILANKAKTRGVRERRTVPFSSLGPGRGGRADGPADRFQGEGDAGPVTGPRRPARGRTPSGASRRSRRASACARRSPRCPSASRPC